MATVSSKPEPLSDEVVLTGLKLSNEGVGLGLTDGHPDLPVKKQFPCDGVHLTDNLSADGEVGLTNGLQENEEVASGEITAVFAPAHAVPAPAVPALVLPLQPTPAVTAPLLPLQPVPAPPPAPVVDQINNNPWIRVVRRHRHGQQVLFADDDVDEPFMAVEIEEEPPSSEEEDDLECLLWEPNTKSRRAAMKWSQARMSSMVGTKNGPGVFVYGSYGPGFQY